MPLEYRPFTFKADRFQSQLHEFAKSINVAKLYVGKQAWWVADRGFDASRWFELTDRAGLRTVTRLNYGKKERHLVVKDGRSMPVSKVAASVEMQMAGVSLAHNKLVPCVPMDSETTDR